VLTSHAKYGMRGMVDDTRVPGWQVRRMPGIMCAGASHQRNRSTVIEGEGHMGRQHRSKLNVVQFLLRGVQMAGVAASTGKGRTGAKRPTKSLMSALVEGVGGTGGTCKSTPSPKEQVHAPTGS
jgi:hypothetical protein